MSKGYNIGAAKIFVETLIDSLEVHLKRRPTDSEIVAYILGTPEERLKILDKPVCVNHKPRQHRDGKSPWCEACGMTAEYETPKRFGHKSAKRES